MHRYTTCTLLPLSTSANCAAVGFLKRIVARGALEVSGQKNSSCCKAPQQGPDRHSDFLPHKVLLEKMKSMVRWTMVILYNHGNKLYLLTSHHKWNMAQRINISFESQICQSMISEILHQSINPEIHMNLIETNMKRSSGSWGTFQFLTVVGPDGTLWDFWSNREQQKLTTDSRFPLGHWRILTR